MQPDGFTSATNRSELHVRLVERHEGQRYQEQMALHHYLGCLSKIGETLWYVAIWGEQWVALLSISAAALKCGVRDRWIGWDFTSHPGSTAKHPNPPQSPMKSRLKRAETLVL